jgi:hypothetical protein
VRIRQSFEHLFDEKLPLLPQLATVKRACFRPYLSNFQIIHYLCERCSEIGEYHHCDFYEATHLDCFREHLEQILMNENIKKPKIFHQQTERLCFGRIHLEEILFPSYEVWKIKESEPMWVGTQEHREWTKKRKEAEAKLRCASKCKMAQWCQFYQNNINEILTFTDITWFDEDEIFYDQGERTFDKGFITKSYLYKNFINPSKKKEPEGPVIITDNVFKRLSDKHYKTYEKIFNKVKNIPDRIKVDILKYHLYLLMGEGDALIAYLFGRIFGFECDIIKEQMKIHDLQEIDVEKSLKRLEQLNLRGDLEATCNFKKMRRSIQNNGDILGENPGQLIRLDLTLLLEYRKQQKLEWRDIFYEYFLHCEKSPSRKDIERQFKITQPIQIIIEKRLGTRKDFRNKGKIQLTNLYLVNRCIQDNIFEVLSWKEAEARLKTVATLNRERVRQRKLFTRDKQPKLSKNQLIELDKLHQQLTSNKEKEQRAT